MADIHARYDPRLGAAVVGLLERLQVFQVFSSWWFSAALVVLMISIVCCTLDRTPRLWRQSRDIRVVQPEPFFDPSLPDRAADRRPDRGRRRERRSGATGSASARPSDPDGTTYLYGDRHRWTKLATLLTHLGLILFLVAAAVTSRLGFEAGLLADRRRDATGPVDRDARPARRQELRLRGAPAARTAASPTSRPTSPSTRDGQELARKIDPRQRPAVGRPASRSTRTGSGRRPTSTIRDATGSGPVGRRRSR